MNAQDFAKIAEAINLSRFQLSCGRASRNAKSAASANSAFDHAARNIAHALLPPGAVWNSDANAAFLSACGVQA